MPSSFTPNRGYELMATGEDYGQWGVKLNAIISSLDTSNGGQLLLNNPATQTLTSAQAINNNIILTGNIPSNITITFPAINGLYWIDDAATGTGVITIAGNSGSTTTLPRYRASLLLITVYSPVLFYNPDTYIYLDTGAANNYAINVGNTNYQTTVTSFVQYRVKIANTNTGASTLAVTTGGVTTKNITTKAGAALGAGALVAGGIYNFVYDGTQFQIL